MPADDEFMTVAEVAAILKLNQQTVRNWIDSGFLPRLRVGRRVRIKRSDFDALEASYSGPQAGATGWHLGGRRAPAGRLSARTR